MPATPQRKLPSVHRPGKTLLFASKPGMSPSPMVACAPSLVDDGKEEADEEDEEEVDEEEEESDEDVDEEMEDEEDEEVEEEGETLLDDGTEEVTEEITDEDEELEDHVEPDAHVEEPKNTEVVQEQLPVESNTGKRKRASITPTPNETTITDASDNGELHPKKPKVDDTTIAVLERMAETLENLLAHKKEKFLWTKAKYEERKKERKESARLEEERRKLEKTAEKKWSKAQGKHEALLAAINSPKPFEDLGWLSLIYN